MQERDKHVALKSVCRRETNKLLNLCSGERQTNMWLLNLRAGVRQTNMQLLNLHVGERQTGRRVMPLYFGILCDPYFTKPYRNFFFFFFLMFSLFVCRPLICIWVDAHCIFLVVELLSPKGLDKVLLLLLWKMALTTNHPFVCLCFCLFSFRTCWILERPPTLIWLSTFFVISCSSPPSPPPPTSSLLCLKTKLLF